MAPLFVVIVAVVIFFLSSRGSSDRLVVAGTRRDIRATTDCVDRVGSRGDVRIGRRV
jgi:hypothetical protein